MEIKNERRFYHEREIRWCRLGKNIGFEQAGSGERFERPVLILKSISREICLIVPLTRSNKKHPLRFVIDDKSIALLSQVRVIDTKRLSNYMKTISEDKFKEIKNTIQKMFE